MKKSLSIAQANVLFLITMVLVLTAGSAVQLLSLSWGLVATELFLILLPTVIFLRMRRIPLREGLRLRPIGLRLAVVSALLGISTWFYVSFIDALMMQISGLPPVAITNDMLPSGVLESAAYFIALAILAPIGEEALFRGAIQGAYERQRSARFAIIVASLMFAFYHFRVTGLPALLPIALTLGYVGWRTQSLYAVILVHFGNNAVSAVYGLLSMNIADFNVSITNPLTAGIGLVTSVGLLYLLRRMVPAPAAAPLSAPEAEDEAADATVKTQPSWIKNYWALIVSGLLFALLGGATLAASLNPELTAARGITFSEPTWTEPAEYHYVITNRIDEAVGEAACSITPGTDTTQLDCTRRMEGYEIDTGSSFFSESTHTLTWSATWNAQTLELVHFELERSEADGSTSLTAVLDGTRLTVSTSDGSQMTEEVGEDILLGHEWAWRMMFMDDSAGTASMVPFGYLLTWDEAEKRSHPQVREELLRLAVLDPVTVPAGRFDAWKVTIGNDKAAWYNGETLLRYDDGMSIYSLAE